MARPQKSGLDYFPLDVDFYRDRKVRALTARHGVNAQTLFIVLLCRIYEEGYYLNFDKLELSVVSADINLAETQVSSIIASAAEFGLFDKDIYEKHSVLTSDRIQEQFVLSTTRRKRDTNALEHWLLSTLTPLSRVSASSVLTKIPKVKESKVKESKVKESKVKKERAPTPEPKKRYGEFVLLTDRERELLAEKPGEPLVSLCIDFLNLHIGQKGEKAYRRSTKSDWHAIHKWVVGAVEERAYKQKRNGTGQTAYDRNRAARIAAEQQEAQNGKI